MDRKQFVENQLKSCKEKWGLDISVSFDMPKGFETAFGMFDVTKNVLFVSLSSKIDDARFLFTFYHELRHALQYNFPEKFDAKIQKSLPYAVHFDGNCYRLVDNKWKHCSLPDALDYESIYLSLPYERDANEFAYAQARKHVAQAEEERLQEIFKRSLPKCECDMPNLENVFSKIDDCLREVSVKIIEKIAGDRIDLMLNNFVPEVPEKKFVNYCNYDIVLHGTQTAIGTCSAKLGHNDLIFYIGNVGYSIDEEYRGNGYAGEAVKLLTNLFKANGFDKIYITNVPENNSSRRVCEKLGAKFLGTFEIPEDNIRRRDFGETHMNIFEIEINNY